MQRKLESNRFWSSLAKMWEKSKSCILIALFLFTITIALVFCSGETTSFNGDAKEMDIDQPLILTPLIKRGELKKAKSLSEVHYFKELGNVISYSGYFTTNETFNSNLFFWFFPAQKNSENAPVFLWLQGGPGQPSTIGLFAENGPIYVTNDGQDLHFRNITWTIAFNMLYIDSPVGSGCSFTTQNGYATTNYDVTANLHEALLQFFAIFSEYRWNDFYITGESYTGKYAPNLGKWIHEKNNEGKFPKINLKGLAIGNGFVDPERMLQTGDNLYNLGLLDELGRDYFRMEESKAVKLIQENKIYEANNVINALIHMEKSEYELRTGLHQYYNILNTNEAPYLQHMEFLQKPEIRKAIHIGNFTCVYGYTVSHYLQNDIFVTAKPALEFLLDRGYKILLYSGNLDIIVATPSTVNLIQNLHWKYSHQYKKTPRIIWTLNNGTVAGYVKKVQNLFFVIVRNAGHMAVMDQPEYCLDMIMRFTNDKEFI